MTKQTLSRASLPAPKSRPRTTAAAVRSGRKERLWLASFQFDEPAVPGVNGPHGHFVIVVRATTPTRALDLCRVRLRELRTTTSLFDTPCTIYLDHLIAIPDVPTKPALLSYAHMQYFGNADRGEILSGLPEQEDLGGEFEVFGPSEKNDKATPVFLDFGGESSNEALAQAMRGRTPSQVAPPPPRPPLRRPKSR